MKKMSVPRRKLKVKGRYYHSNSNRELTKEEEKI